MAINLLSDSKISKEKPKDKDFTLLDGGVLTLLVKASGVKRWTFIYRFNGKQKRLGLGVYGEKDGVSLASAITDLI